MPSASTFKLTFHRRRPTLDTSLEHEDSLMPHALRARAPACLARQAQRRPHSGSLTRCLALSTFAPSHGRARVAQLQFPCLRTCTPSPIMRCECKYASSLHRSRSLLPLDRSRYTSSSCAVLRARALCRARDCTRMQQVIETVYHTSGKLLVQKARCAVRIQHSPRSA